MVGVRSHYVASVLAARLMVKQHLGLIASISSYAGAKYTSHVVYGVAKAAVDWMMRDMAHELRSHHVATVSIWLGVVTTEMFLRRREGKSGKWPKVESPHYVGQAVVALATDVNLMSKTGQVLQTRELAAEYGFTDPDIPSPAQ